MGKNSPLLHSKSAYDAFFELRNELMEDGHPVANLGAIWSCVSSNFFGKKGLKHCHKTCDFEVEIF